MQKNWLIKCKRNLEVVVLNRARSVCLAMVLAMVGTKCYWVQSGFLACSMCQRLAKLFIRFYGYDCNLGYGILIIRALRP